MYAEQSTARPTQGHVCGASRLLFQHMLSEITNTSDLYVCFTQGLGRHSQHDFNLLIQQDLATLSALLGDKPYLLGDAPTEADAAVFGVLDVILHDGIISRELRDMVERFPNLCQHTQLVRETFFPDRLGILGEAGRKVSFEPTPHLAKSL